VEIVAIICDENTYSLFFILNHSSITGTSCNKIEIPYVLTCVSTVAKWFNHTVQNKKHNII